MSDINNDKEDITASIEKCDNNSELDRSEMGGISAFDLPIGDLVPRRCEYYPPTVVDLEAWRSRHPCTLKLYKANSLFDHSEYGQMKWYWYVSKRDKQFPFPYETLIYGYGGDLDDHGYPDRNKEVIDECFTESEIDQLREYLEQPDMPFYEFHVREIDLPITDPLWPTGDTLYSSEGDFTFFLNDFEDYSLPFEVAGHAFIPEAAGYFVWKAGGFSWKSQKEIYGE
jgi:hypothetical protein